MNSSSSVINSRGCIVAVTGGIGSGKSVVCRMLAAMDCPVYDSDLRARALMERSDEIKRRICEEISEECVSECGIIDRARLGALVFADRALLLKLNSIVHGAVRQDFRQWCVRHSQAPICVLETAILYESGMDKLVDEIWEVTAPLELRIRRVELRNNMQRQQIIGRIKAQEATEYRRRHPRWHEIVNDGVQPLLPQVLQLLGCAKSEASSRKEGNCTQG